MIKAYQKAEGRVESFFEITIMPALSRLAKASSEGDGQGFLAPKVVGDGVILGRSSWLFLSAAGSLDYYKGTNLLSEEELENCAEKIETLNRLCGERGIRLVVFFAPNKEQVYPEYMPDYTVENEYKRTARLADYLNGHTGVSVLYPLKELERGKALHGTYLRYDTHWNDYGAFIGSMSLLEALGEDAEDPFDPGLTGTVYDRTYGDLIQLGALQGRQFPEDEVFRPDFRPETKLLLEEGGYENETFCRTKSTAASSRRLVLIGDSFRIQMISYLSRAFPEALFLHRDYRDESFDAEILSCGVLVLEAVERFDFQLFNVADELIALLSGQGR